MNGTPKACQSFSVAKYLFFFTYLLGLDVRVNNYITLLHDK